MFCYLCDQTLDAATKSIEHIIPNAIGGRLKSAQLLCKKCNSVLGENYDAVLCNQLSPLANLLDIPRERGYASPIKNLNSSGEQYNLIRGRHIELSRPTVEMLHSKNQVHVVARSEKELQTILKGLKQKYPNLDTTNLQEKITRTNSPLREPLTGNFTIGGDAFLKAILKMMINFYLLKARDKSSLNAAVSLLKNDTQLDNNSVRHYVNANELDTDNIYHTLYVKGAPQHKRLFGYIELFSSFSFLVMLNSDYKGPDLEYTFRWDVCAAEEADVNLELDYEEVYRNSYRRLNEQLIVHVTKKLNRLIAISEERQFELMVREISRDAARDIFGNKPQGVAVTKEMVQAYYQKVAEDVAPLVAHLYRTKCHLVY